MPVEGVDVTVGGTLMVDLKSVARHVNRYLKPDLEPEKCQHTFYALANNLSQFAGGEPMLLSESHVWDTSIPSLIGMRNRVTLFDLDKVELTCPRRLPRLDFIRVTDHVSTSIHNHLDVESWSSSIESAPNEGHQPLASVQCGAHCWGVSN